MVGPPPTRQRTASSCWFPLVVRFSFVYYVLLSRKTALVSAIDSQGDAIHVYVEEMVHWLRVNGGFMSEKVEIRRRVPGDRSSPSGIFAASDIATDEVIFRVPSRLYLSIGNHDDPLRRNNTTTQSEEYDMATYYQDQCLLSKRLLDEMKLFRVSPSSSKFASYIRYLEDLQPKGQLPATFSEPGKALLRKIQGFAKNDQRQQAMHSAHYGQSPLPPGDLVDWIDKYFVESGCIDANDADAYHAVALVVQRGFDLELIPVWDMVNHDVQERVNIRTNSVRSSEGLVVWANRPISAGEEIFYSYNYCADCDDTGKEWGTPGIFRDFGFLEDYPQEWPFLDQKVSARIHQDKENPQNFYATWMDLDDELGHLVGAMIDEESLAFFQAQLSRLKSINIKMELQPVSPSHERHMIHTYFDSLVIALSSVIEQQQATGVQSQYLPGDDSCIKCVA